MSDYREIIKISESSLALKRIHELLYKVKKYGWWLSGNSFILTGVIENLIINNKEKH